MKKYLELATSIAIIAFVAISCEKDYIEPFDIFETETLTDTCNVNLGSSVGLDTLYVNADRIIETYNGYHIKGSLFSKSLDGIIPITNGDFTIIINVSTSSLKKGFKANNYSFEFSGYGTADFPHVGMLKDFEIDDIPGSETYYNTGKVFKEESKITTLPLLDERYYFRYKIDNPKKGKEYKLKNITYKLREFYLDAHDPATIFYGDMYSKNKAGVKKLIAQQVGFGLSANELWEFTPYTYSDRLEEAVGGTGFYNINGGIYISGIVPLKKYPLKVFGQAVINTSYSSHGTFDFFDRGFDDASFQIAANGNLLFDNKFVPFIPGLDTVKLGKATMMAELGDDGNSIRAAGEYSDDYLKAFLGKYRLQFISYKEQQGIMYLRCNEDFDDLIIYLEQNINLTIPGFGDKEIANSVFKVTKDGVELSGTINLPYDIGNVDVIGQINTDGSFLLKGTADSKVTLKDGLSFKALLDVEVSNNGVSLSGTVNLPYNIGDVELTGAVSTSEISLSGTFSSNIKFKDVELYCTDVTAELSSNTGVYLSGGTKLPAGIGDVDISGEITKDKIELTGMIASGININIKDVKIKTKEEMSLTLSSDIGGKFTGNVSLPFKLGDLWVACYLKPDDNLKLKGTLSSTILGFHASLSVKACTTADPSDGIIYPGVYLDGHMTFPGNFGEIHMGGSVTSSSYSLYGELNGVSVSFGFGSIDIDFEFDVSSNGGVKVSGDSEFCITVDFEFYSEEFCKDFGVEVKNINTGNPKLCVDFELYIYTYTECFNFW